MAIKAVCFDLGGVVARISYRWAEMLHRLSLPVPSHISPADGLLAMPTFDKYQAGELSDTQYFHDLACYLGGLTFEQAKAVHASMLIEPFPGIREIVLELNRRDFVTGCLSNTNAPHWQVLAHSDRFPAILDMQIRMASFEIDAAKPDTAAFTAFESAAGCEPTEIILFDDGAENCEAAKDLGWYAVLIDPNADPATQIRAELTARGVV